MILIQAIVTSVVVFVVVFVVVNAIHVLFVIQVEELGSVTCTVTNKKIH